jgi:hypothetical protein
MISAVLDRAARTLERRLAQLEERLTRGDDTAWPEYATAAASLATVSAQLSPEATGRLLTTGELATRIGVSPKTILRRKARGQLKPALVLGKRGRGAIRWRGDEAVAR